MQRKKGKYSIKSERGGAGWLTGYDKPWPTPEQEEKRFAALRVTLDILKCGGFPYEATQG